jgi:hypothetical protein
MVLWLALTGEVVIVLVAIAVWIWPGVVLHETR